VARIPRRSAERQGILSSAMSLLAVALLAAARTPDPACGSAPTAHEQSAQAPEPSAAKLLELERELERLAEQYHVPGMSAAVVHRRALAWSQGFGYSDLEQETWAMPETRYQTASVAKPMAAVLILQLVEQGKLSLDAPMKDFRVYHWFAPDPARYREQPVLLRHLLTHTSEGVPGEEYAYNGNTYFDLTWVVEDVTRTAYPRLLQERIFDRAGMDRSVPGYAPPGTVQLVELARPYKWERDDYWPTKYQMIDPDPALDLEGFDVVLKMPAKAIAARRELLGEGFMRLNGANAAAEVTTTVLDLAKFDIALDEGRLIGAASRERMWTPAVSNRGKTLPYALGWFVEEFAGRKVIWHTGLQPPSVSALYVKVPAAELSFFLLASNDGLTKSFPWWDEGVRAIPFAQAFLRTFGLLED
jgi:CubicO group peptidase (beta-lactamase class C family)